MAKGNNLSAWSDADRKARREKEEHEKKLAQLGARALAILNDLGPGYPNYMRYSAIEEAARELSLLSIGTPEEERLTPLDEERASFHRETLERRHDD